ncbi:hypothetical protein PAMA_001209 [Pampus argenteus]
MVDIVIKPFMLVLIITAHTVFNVHSQVEVTGILGTNITLQFIFNVTVTKNSHVAVYVTGQRKIAQYTPGKNGSGGGVFDVFPGNVSVFFRISNLKLNHSDNYSASLFMDSGVPKESNKVQLIVQEQNQSTTVSPMPTNSVTTEYSGSPSRFPFHAVTVLVVSSVVLLAVVIPLFVWCLVRTKEKNQQSSIPTVQETVEASNHVPAPSLVYSILDFPKRPPAVLEMNLNDTEYAAVSYLPEKRQV